MVTDRIEREIIIEQVIRIDRPHSGLRKTLTKAMQSLWGG